MGGVVVGGFGLGFEVGLLLPPDVPPALEPELPDPLGLGLDDADDDAFLLAEADGFTDGAVGLGTAIGGTAAWV